MRGERGRLELRALAVRILAGLLGDVLCDLDRWRGAHETGRAAGADHGRHRHRRRETSQRTAGKRLHRLSLPMTHHRPARGRALTVAPAASPISRPGTTPTCKRRRKNQAAQSLRAAPLTGVIPSARGISSWSLTSQWSEVRGSVRPLSAYARPRRLSVLPSRRLAV